MSHGCSSATAPFKITVWEGEPEMDENLPEDHPCDDCTICPDAPKGFQEFFTALEPVNSGREKSQIVRGWKICGYKTIDPKRSVYGHVVTKDDFLVFYVNENEGSNVGYETASFVSKDEKSIEAFKKDFGFRQKIQTNVPVLEWS